MYSVPGWKCWRICRRLPLRNTQIKRRISAPRRRAEAGLRAREPGGSPLVVPHEYPSRISFHISDLLTSAIFSHQRSSPRRHAVRRQGCRGLVCVGPSVCTPWHAMPRTLSGRVARLQSGLSAAAPLIEALDRAIEETPIQNRPEAL